jgi:hypothetical protein
MSNISVHLISDLNLGYNELSQDDETIPDVDLVVINGNLGHPKRGMLYMEKLCAKYPDTQFVCNLGESELYIESNYPKTMDEVKLQTLKRKTHNETWPKNLHYSLQPMIINLRNNQKVDVFCLYGFPFIHSIKGQWEETNWHRYYYKELIEDYQPEGKPYKPAGTSNVNHGAQHIPADKDWVNKEHEKEWLVVKKWELENNGCYKILVTHFSPYNDPRLVNQEYGPYNIHIDKSCLWLTASSEHNGVQFLGGKLYGNPGRGSKCRSKVITMN